MSREREKVFRLVETSRKVLQDCQLENGAIVAVNTAKPYASAHPAKDYFAVWPRDAAYILLAADVLGLDMHDAFIRWVETHAELWKEEGVFYQNYAVNGNRIWHGLQIDQTGSMVHAVCEHVKRAPTREEREARLKRYARFITHSAEGILRVWHEDHFTRITNDLWEERFCFPDMKEYFTYSLAMTARGLADAGACLEKEEYARVAEEMRHVLLRDWEKLGFFGRSAGRMRDDRIDASLLGIIWPGRMIPPDHPLAQHTVDRIRERLVKEGGVYRYEYDEYDGWYSFGLYRKKGAGYWPLLNFWLSSVLVRMQRRDEAEAFYWKAVRDVDTLIPEQVHAHAFKPRIQPLCWAHAMFILASRDLGFIEENAPNHPPII